MIESPVLQELWERTVANSKQDSIIRVLNARFKTIPDEVVATLRTVRDTGAAERADRTGRHLRGP